MLDREARFAVRSARVLPKAAQISPTNNATFSWKDTSKGFVGRR